MSSPRRALLVVDVQNDYFDGALPIVHPPVAQSLPNILQAMDAATAHDVPVLVVQHTAPAPAPVFAEGSAGWDLHRQVAARPHTRLLRKTRPSVFAGTDLADWLRRQAIDTLTVAGYMTHNCTASTVYAAFHRGLTVEVLGDASGALPYANAAGRASAEEIHRVFGVVFHSNFAAVADTAQWIAALQDGAALPRDNVLQSNRRARGAA